jgi:hypothetical protein
VIDALGPVVRQARLQFIVDDSYANSVLERVGLAVAFPEASGHDLLSVRTSNANPSKIDTYLRRSISYDARYDPETGHVAATATITLTNDAPTTGLPDYVIGNRDLLEEKADGRPRGSNTMYLSVYSPLETRSATLDGQPLPLEQQVEFGYRVSSTFLTVPAGTSRVVSLELDGQIASGSTYRLTLPSQPLVNNDRVIVHMRSDSDSWTADGGQEGEFDLTERRDLALSLSAQ